MPASTDTGVALSQRAKFGIFVPPSSTSPVNGLYHAAEGLLGVVSPIAGIFCSFDTSWSGHAAEWTDFASSVTPRTLQIAWMPQKTTGTVDLSTIPAGAYDTHINQMLTGMNAYAGTVIVRFGHEMNGNWYKWSVGYTGPNKGVSSVADYIAAWRYIVTKAKASGGNMAPNVKWLFCPNGQDVGGTPMEAYYPGDAYVDLLGLDSYNNYATDHDASWTTPYATFQPMYDRVELLNATYDIWIGETGCMDQVPNRSKATWFSQLFAETHFSRLKGVTYFDAVGGQDWRFQTSTASAAAAATGFQGVLGAVPYSGPAAPSFTIPASTAFMVQSSLEAKPRYRVDTAGKLEWSDGTATADTRIQRAGAGILDAGPAIKLANSSAPAQQGNGPVVYGKNGAVYVVPQSGPEYILRRQLLDAHGLKAISIDPAMCSSSGALTSGRIYFARVRVEEATTLTGVAICVSAVGATLTSGSNFVGLYDTSGNRLAISADLTSGSPSFATLGNQSVPFTATYSATAGSYLIAVLSVGTTGVGLARNGISTTSPYAHNFNTTGINSRFSSFTTTGQTTLPSTISTGSIDGATSLPLLLGLY